MPPFLTKLYDILSDPALSPIVSWDSSGRSFVVHDAPSFASDVLPKFWRHNNTRSFVRQLNNYCFVRSPANLMGTQAFSHQCFVRGRRELLSQISRARSAHKREHEETEVDRPTVLNASISALHLKLHTVEANLMQQLSTLRAKVELLTNAAQASSLRPVSGPAQRPAHQPQLPQASVPQPSAIPDHAAQQVMMQQHEQMQQMQVQRLQLQLQMQQMQQTLQTLHSQWPQQPQCTGQPQQLQQPHQPQPTHMQPMQQPCEPVRHLHPSHQPEEQHVLQQPRLQHTQAGTGQQGGSLLHPLPLRAAPTATPTERLWNIQQALTPTMTRSESEPTHPDLVARGHPPWPSSTASGSQCL